MQGIWLVVAEESVLGGLAEAAHRLDGQVSAVVVGEPDLADKVARVVERVDWFPTTPEVPAEAWAPAVADLIEKAGASIVLSGNASASRVVIGAVAARLGSPLLDPVQEVRPGTSGVEVTRLVFGGIAVETDACTGPVCVVVEGSPKQSEKRHHPVAVTEIKAEPLAMRCSVEQHPAPIGRDLATAPRVIGVGRGLRDPDYLTEVEQLAAALGAELACSRPVAEDLGWLPHDRYLGVSGRRIAPKLYLMLGISGEVQHMIGVRDAELIVAVNSDSRAPVMSDCDLAVVGDLRAFVPALIELLTPVEREAVHA
jgi:electron transfer flavoprotein alpha subunit